MSPDLAKILRGPQIVRLLVDAGSPLVEIEPLRFHPVYRDGVAGFRVSRTPV